MEKLLNKLDSSKNNEKYINRINSLRSMFKTSFVENELFTRNLSCKRFSNELGNFNEWEKSDGFSDSWTGPGDGSEDWGKWGKG